MNKIHIIKSIAISSICALATFSCAQEDFDNEQDVSTISSTTSPLHLTEPTWPSGVVPVCWEPASVARADFSLRSRQVRDLANASWPTVANIEFTGWGTCPTTTSYVVRIALNDSGNADALIGYYSNSYMNLGVARSDFTGGLVAHEFGHVLGFRHEMSRPDFVDDASGGCREGDVSGGTYLNTPADRQSIMASTGYCQHNTQLSMWDIVGSINAYGPRTNIVSPLVTAYNGTRQDHATIATPAAIAAATTAAYSWPYAEGFVFNSQIQGTVPLKLYWHPTRQDNYSTATATGESLAISAGYTFVRNEGYVFSASQPGTIAVKQFWHPTRLDNMLTTSATGESIALAAGYSFARIEGYIPQTTPYALGWTYWQPTDLDNLVAAQSSATSVNAANAGYGFSGFDGAFWRFAYPGTTPLKTYFSNSRKDHFALGTAASETAATAAGYSFVGNEGYVHTGTQPGESTINSYWHATRQDHFTTVGRKTWATGSGYSLVRTEGYAIPIND